MRKEWIIAIVCIILLILGVIAGIYVYQINNTKDSNNLDGRKLAQNNSGNNDYENIDKEQVVLSTSWSEERLSPSAKLVEREYFKGCNHITTNTRDLPNTLANCNVEELAEKCDGWQIEEFANNEVTLYREQDGFCDEHYLIKEHNGVLGIYTTDEKGEETFKEDTDIQTMYLTEADLTEVRNGIEAIGDVELHSVLEDFE